MRGAQPLSVLSRGLLLAASLSAPPLWAQQPPPSNAPGHNEPRPAVQAVERAGPVNMDGRPDEPAWSAAPVAGGFIQQIPREREPATQRTEVRFLYDDAALYIGARMFDTEGGAGVRGRLVRRDQDDMGDYLALVFDTYHDHTGRTYLQVNPTGTRTDAGQAASYLDVSWDPVWNAVTAVDSLGWSAELRIPWNQLRFPRDSLQTWGLQVWRYEERLNETSMWAFWGLNEQGGPPRFGHLDGLRFGARPRAVELLPYLVGKGAYVRPQDTTSPFQEERDYSWRTGADLKAVLSSSLTLDATFNPDFGQVEADPAVINLSAYESYFQEKRPFFVEGSGLFSFGSFNCYFCSNVSSLSLFYTRRIGRPPHGAAPSGTQAESIDATTILSAAKITGRTAAGWQVGLLDAVTAPEHVRYVSGIGGTRTLEVEPLTNYFVGRLRRNLRGGTVRVGLMGTSVLRELGEPTLRAALPAHAEAIGADWELTWKSQRYAFRGNLAFSNVSGSDAAITALQRSSARYFQRPDRDAHGNGLLSNAYDPAANSLRGLGGYARLAKEQGTLLWETAVNFRSPGFEVNDLAFLSRADYAWMNANIGAMWTKPTRWYRQLGILAGGQQQYNFDGDLTGRQLHAYVGGELTNYWNWEVFGMLVPNTLSDQVTRGGPVVLTSGHRAVYFNVDTDRRKRLQFGLHPNYGVGNDGFQFWNLGANLRARVLPNLSLSLEPGFGDFGSRQQFVTAFADSTATAFYGRRVVIADIRQHQLSLDTRVSATFTPDLTLEVYLQPFVGSGHYSDFKEYVRPRSLETRSFADQQQFGNRDFNFRSLRGNAVLRWEYRPGSTLYLAWQQNRAGAQPYGDFDASRDVEAIFRQHADNTFLVKVSYWLGR